MGMTTVNNNLGRIIKQQRALAQMTLRDLATRSGISASHLGRVEMGERFPSAHILQKVAGPLGFEEGELFALAGYLSPKLLTAAETMAENNIKQLDPIAANMLRQEPIEIQRSVVAILTILKGIAKQIKAAEGSD